jgi:preprotein translocase subunit SecY
MLATVLRALKISDLRSRILFTLAMIGVFRVGVHVPVPGVDTEIVQQMIGHGTLFSFLDVFAGGALAVFSIFAMGIIPYINASIIMQLLTIVVPKFEEWRKEGQEGRRKLTQITRYGTVVLAAIQAFGLSYAVRPAIIDPNPLSYAIIIITLTAGTAFLMWLGEHITEHGIGNGISLLIFAGIVSRLPLGVQRMFTFIAAGVINILNLLALIVIGLVVIAAVVWIQEGQRRIPVQYAKRVVGRRLYGGQSTFIPMKVNTAGVIPVIFAVSVLAFPATVAQFWQHPLAQRFGEMFGYQTATYVIIQFLLIIFFTYFYTSIQFNPADVANNMKKAGGFIPGLRPGRPTAAYLQKVLMRITLVGSIFLATVAIMPNFIMTLTGIPNVYLGGTALLIVVGVALETMKQIEAHLVMRHYQGFIR